MKNNTYIIGQLVTPVGSVNKVSTSWSTKDVVDTVKVRWAVGRMKYMIKQGLYAVGQPNSQSQVFVTANYKLSFDHLRRALEGVDAWMLVLDTKGINVWCAAGKGTFGTNELVYRIKAHGLEKIVEHRQIIVPQLGAVGVAAHEVKDRTGFKVIYGPVQAEDIKAFLNNNLKATEDMRRIKFPFPERVKLIPVELFYGGMYILLVPAIFFILAGLGTQGYVFERVWSNGGRAVLGLLTAYVSGCVITPALLPWIPFRRFSLKGLFTGSMFFALLVYFGFQTDNLLETISWLLIIGSISSFTAMNFTGASTYTSLSGVQKEMKTALPIQIVAAALGFIAWIISRFI